MQRNSFFFQFNFLFYTLKELKRTDEIILAKVSKADVYFKLYKFLIS